MKLFNVLAFIFMVLIKLNAQPARDQVIVDKDGIMRWSANNKEIYGFGVNYTIPFAHEYRMVQKTGISVEEAIKQDVYHFCRLDLDLYRVHVWDTEISDTLGNLIDNEHLRLFDFLINEMKQRGMHFIITPIAYWGNGWPEPDEKTPGFSHKYGKGQCLTTPAAIDAQAKYLNQFLNHKNRYTGLAYKDEPNLIAFEICNEPQHHEAPEQITAFINKMVASMRETGCTKPIFYNVSQIYNKSDAYLAANIQGTTFQWYPTNLVANHALQGNFLPQVQTYPVPFADNPRYKQLAKIVYEFDPADVAGNIMYPAMARTFREAGMQLAAQFAYDAMSWAPYNTNYGTHFMNLAYAPNKAISLKIASAVFHNVPLYQKQNDIYNYNGFHISYPDDLAEWVTNEKFFYSNNTSSQPVNTAKLNEIAGVGSSPLVKYSGTGAYFLDKLADGIWRLEIMPDAYWIDDPYSPAKPNRQKAAVLHAPQQMKISIPELGTSFSMQVLNKDNAFVPKPENGQFEVIPGVYLLIRNGAKNKILPDQKYKNIVINEYVAPASNLDKVVLWNDSPLEIIEHEKNQISIRVVSPVSIYKVSVVMSNGDTWKTVETSVQANQLYQVEIPVEVLNKGFLNYRILVEDKNGTTKFPGGIAGDPWSWDNRNDDTYTIKIIPHNSRLVIWDAATDWDFSYKIWNRLVTLKPVNSDETALSVELPALPSFNQQNLEDSSYAFKFFFKNKIKGRYNELTQKKQVVLKVINLSSYAQPVEISLIDRNGSVKTGKILVNPNDNLIRLPFDSFTDGNYLTIPRPYPDFIPYRVNSNIKPFEWNALESLQLEIKPGLKPAVNISIEQIGLE